MSYDLIKSITAFAIVLLFTLPMAHIVAYWRIEMDLSRIKCLVVMATWGIMVGFVLSYFWQFV